MPPVHTSKGATDTRDGPIHVDESATEMENNQTRADEGVVGKANGFQHRATNRNALLNAPLKLTHLLDEFKSFDVTPVIGTEFPDVQLTDWLRAPNSDALLRDLAITSKYSLLSVKSWICARTISHHHRYFSLSTWGRILSRSG